MIPKTLQESKPMTQEDVNKAIEAIYKNIKPPVQEMLLPAFRMDRDYTEEEIKRIIDQIAYSYNTRFLMLGSGSLEAFDYHVKRLGLKKYWNQRVGKR